MNKIKLNSVFKEIKQKANMDYAIPSPDKYGDCNTCVLYGLADAFGENSTGIYAKHWRTGMNAGKPWKYLDHVYVNHDITEEQARIMIQVLQESGYSVTPEEYDPTKSFLIKELW